MEQTHRGTPVSDPKPVRVIAQDGHLVDTVIFSVHEPLAVVVIAPATGVRKEVYFSFASYLQASSVAVLIFDYVGVGLTATAANQTRTVSQWIKLDLNAVLDFALNRYAEHRVMLLGHSLGGQFIGVLPNAHRLSKIVMVAVGIGYWKLMGFPQKYWYRFATHLLLPVLASMGGSFPPRWSGWKGEQLPRPAALEWSRWCRSPAYAFRYLSAEDLNATARLTVPTLALLFSDDAIGTSSAASRLLGYYEQLPVEKRVICAKTGNNNRIGHTGFFSRKSKALWPELLGWILSH